MPTLEELTSSIFRRKLTAQQKRELVLSMEEIDVLEEEIYRREALETNDKEKARWTKYHGTIEQLRDRNRRANQRQSPEEEDMPELSDYDYGNQEGERSEDERSETPRDIINSLRQERTSHNKHPHFPKEKQRQSRTETGRPNNKRASSSHEKDKRKSRDSKRRRRSPTHSSSSNSSSSSSSDGSSAESEESNNTEEEYFRPDQRDVVTKQYRDNYSFAQAIEPFDGDFSKWAMFKNVVEDLILDATDIKQSMKATLISKLLKGESKAIWNNSLANKIDLKKGWKALISKYENQTQIDTYLQSLIAKMPLVANDTDVKALANMNTQILEFKCLMDRLGSAFHVSARSFCVLIANKFWNYEAKKIKKKCDSLHKLVSRIDRLYREAQTLALHHQEPKSRNLYSNNAINSRIQPRVSSVSTNKHCHFCLGKEHWASECDSGMSFDERRRIIREKNLCGRCCCRGHQVKNCRARIIKCNQCGEDHASAVHGIKTHFVNNQQVFASGNHEESLTQGNPNQPEEVHWQEAGNARRFWTKAYCNNHVIEVLFDTGATITLIHSTSIPRYAVKKVPIIMAKGFAQGMVSALSEMAQVEVNSPYGLIQFEAYLSADLDPNTLIIGRDQIGLFLKEDSKVLRTVWGDYDFETQMWSQTIDEKARCCHVQSWSERQEEEKVEESEISMDVRRLANGQYEARLPFFTDARPSRNYSSAVKKLQAKMGKLKQNGRLAEYGEQIMELMRRGHAEEVSDCNGHFIGHREVERPEAASTKFRVVMTPMELNDLLWKGDAKGLDVLPHLMRLRSCKYAFTADIQKAFLQVAIHPADRHFLRFLWSPDGVIRKYQMTVLPFGIVSAPAILTRVLELIIEETLPPAKSVLQNSLYMDDIITGCNDRQLLKEAVGQLEIIMRKSGFQLHKMRSNVAHLSKAEDLHAEGKILGLRWDPLSDNMTIPLPDKQQPVTRRELLSFIGRIFDPYGVYDPCKLALRAVHNRLLKRPWDEVLDGETQDEIKSLVETFYTEPAIIIPRFIPEKGILWCFSDASQKGLGYVMYLNQYFLFGRAKLITIDRSIVDGELQALFELCKAIPKILANLKSEVEVRVLSDSQANLARLNKSPNEHAIKEARRLFSILKMASRFEASFFHVKGVTNPADYFSRYQTLNQAPNWLQLNVAQTIEHISEKVSVKMICQIQRPRKDEHIRKWLSSKSLSKQLSWIARFKNWYGKACKKEEDCHKSLLDNLVFVYQSDNFSAPTSCIQNKDIWYYASRNPERQQAWIPKDSRLARLLLSDAHHRSCHRGIDMSMALLPESIRIQDGNRQMRKLIAECIRCRFLRAPGVQQPMGPLHANQLRPLQPFEDICLDCFGPLKLANGRKIWGLVTVCRTSQAVKLNVLEDCSGDILFDVLHALWNQVGYPLRIHTDHGSNFLAVRNALAERPSVDTINIRWTLSTPKAPWMNGKAEKMVCSTKQCLKQFVKPVKSHMEAQRRFMSVERIINSRPIIHLDGEVISAFELAFKRKLILTEKGLPIDAPMNMLERRQKRELEIGLLWKSQYLQKASRFCPQKSTPVQVGDMFLVPDRLKRRADWCTAKVKKVILGSDGVCRSAVFKYSTNETLERPLQSMIPLTSARAEN